MKKVVFWAMTMFIAPLFISCGEKNDTTEEQEQEAKEASIRESLKTQGIMNALCQVDTLENGSLNYTPRLGKAIEPSTPTVYYTIGYDLNHARNMFRGIISSLNFSEGSLQEVDEIRQGNIHLTFDKATGAGEIARINVDCPELKNVLTEIVFVTEERWPTNDKASPFNLLDIAKHNGLFYVCVRKADSQNGTMLTLEGGCGQDWFTKYDHWQGKFWLYTNTASSTAFDNLVNLMNNQPNLYKDMCAAMKDAGGPDVWERLFNGDQYWFDRDYSYKHGLWCAYNCYYVDLRKTHIWKSGSTFYTNHYTHHFEHKETPVRNTASSQVGFSLDFNKSDWECIYEGE